MGAEKGPYEAPSIEEIQSDGPIETSPGNSNPPG
jgi:hypothetical protein